MKDCKVIKMIIRDFKVLGCKVDYTNVSDKYIRRIYDINQEELCNYLIVRE